LCMHTVYCSWHVALSVSIYVLQILQHARNKLRAQQCLDHDLGPKSIDTGVTTRAPIDVRMSMRDACVIHAMGIAKKAVKMAVKMAVRMAARMVARMAVNMLDARTAVMNTENAGPVIVVDIYTLDPSNSTQQKILQTSTRIHWNVGNTPRPVCTEVAVTAFNPTVFAKAILYESLALRPQVLTSSTHTMSNVKVDGVAALTMADALLTLVLSPGDTSGALAYFEQNPAERVRLDEVYMSHAKPNVDFGRVQNTLLPVVSAGTGRLARCGSGCRTAAALST